MELSQKAAGTFVDSQVSAPESCSLSSSSVTRRGSDGDEDEELAPGAGPPGGGGGGGGGCDDDEELESGAGPPGGGGGGGGDDDGELELGPRRVKYHPGTSLHVRQQFSSQRSAPVMSGLSAVHWASLQFLTPEVFLSLKMPHHGHCIAQGYSSWKVSGGCWPGHWRGPKALSI